MVIVPRAPVVVESSQVAISAATALPSASFSWMKSFVASFSEAGALLNLSLPSPGSVSSVLVEYLYLSPAQRPSAPVPVGPVAPVGPVGPVGPVAPVGPVGPVAPLAATTSQYSALGGSWALPALIAM